MSARLKKQKAADVDRSTDRSEGSPLSSSGVTRSFTIERSRTTTTTPQHSQSRTERSNSPLSISRSDEKDELAHLNDRLAGYIDYVRKLELDKDRLTRRIKTVSEERLSKVEEARKTYEDEIAALRNLVDELAKQKSQAEMEARKAKEDAADAKSKLSKRDQEIRILQRRIDNLEKDLAAYKQDHDRYQTLLPDYDALEKRFEAVRRDLEAETLLRTDLENKIVGLKEQLDFKSRVFDEEREKLVHKTITIEEEVEGRKQAEYESRLADELRAIRQQTAEEFDEYKIQIEDTFENKLRQMRSSADNNAEDVHRHRSELLLARKRSDELAHDLAKKIAEVELLHRRVDELERQLAKERDDFDSQLRFQQQEVNRLKDELADSFRDFTDLMNTKIALDQEILMYRKMLEGEEARLNIQPESRDSAFNLQPGKRRRLDGDFDDGDETGFTGATSGTSRSKYAYRVSTTTRGPIEFFKEQDSLGKWVKLTNTSTDEVPVGNWELIHEADGKETKFKFHRALIIKPGSSCTIWSSDSETTHNPPTDVVMKNRAFHPGQDISMTLLDGDGIERAKCSVKRERIRSSGVAFGRRLGQRNVQDDKCLTM